MLLIIGFFIVTASTLGGFMYAGGNPIVLLHLSEFIVIGGIAMGVIIIATPKAVLSQTVKDCMGAFSKSGVSKEEMIDLLKLLYELFLVGRRNGLIALDDHVTTPETSAILSKYSTFMNDPHRVEFLVGALRPIIDGKIKPDQLEAILKTEIHTMEEESHGPMGVLALVGDSLPGIGIIAAVLGIINTMGAIADGPEAVGKKVAAALTGTFLGILGAYGFINPLNKRLEFNYTSQFMYYNIIVMSVSGFAKGLAPIMAIEIARRSLDKAVQPEADELETMLKSLNAS